MARKNRDVASMSTDSWLACLLTARESAEIILVPRHLKVGSGNKILSRACTWCYVEENIAMDASASASAGAKPLSVVQLSFANSSNSH